MEICECSKKQKQNKTGKLRGKHFGTLLVGRTS